MIRISLSLSLIFLFIALPARALPITQVFSFSGAGDGLPLTVPDDDVLGVFNSQTVLSNIGTLSSVTVDLQISGTFNGDLYVYLRNSSALSVLVNRVGRTAGNGFGFGDQGFQITLDDSAGADVHLADGGGSLLSGTYQPDGRLVDPYAVLDSDTRLAPLSVFAGTSANGTWDLFLADLSGGESAVLDSWSISLTGLESVPEPGTALPLLLLGLVFSHRLRASRRTDSAKINGAERVPDFNPTLKKLI
jgi:subtilisin-like proprotein convertase family protein